MKNNKPYPTKKVIFAYGILGPLIGTLIYALILFLLNINNLSNANRVLVSIAMLMAVMGFCISIVPAFLMGFWLAKKKTYIQSIKDYFGIFIKGSFSCFIAVILFLMVFCLKNLDNTMNAYQLFDNILEKSGIIVFFTIIGGISSMICGKLFLPKLPKNFNK